LPRWTAIVRRAGPARDGKPARRILVASYLQWWLEHTCPLSLLLAGQGHRVDLAYLPYRSWTDAVDPFDALRQAAYMRRVLEGAEGWFRPLNLLRAPTLPLDEDLGATIERQSRLDVQYTLQREEVERDETGEGDGLFQLRLERNRRAAAAVAALLRRRRYDVVVVPNGSILEFGAMYHAARHAGVPVVTYEFGEQRERLWLAQGSQVMRQDTAEMWTARGGIPLTPSEEARLDDLYRARRGGKAWSNFARQWQAGLSQGAAAARVRLGLDPKAPVVLVCTNVVGDSLALDRQVFTLGMSDWLARTVRHLAGHSGVQVIVRVHPGELLGAGQPSAEIVRRSLPDFGHRVTVIPPESDVNTYDLVELAQLGIVYSSTVGLELAMAGVPVIVCAQTHYRGKGFTEDPASWEAYVEAIDRVLAERPIQPLDDDRVERARRYAYRFFFEYPFAYPWHLIDFWDDLVDRPLESVVLPSLGQDHRRTLDALAGFPVDWGATGRAG
jgi:hypothetical protein